MLHDVVIAGAGPVGLLLACELRLADVSVLVLERADDPRSPFKRLPFGLRGLSVPTLEALDRRGLLDDVTAPQETVSAARRPRGQAGHFAGIALDEAGIDRERWTYRLPGPAAAPAAVEMERLETVLAARAITTGAEVVRGLAVEDVEPFHDEVVVHAGRRSFRARWVVGCDGGRSVVRKVGGFDFVGTDPRLTGYSIQVDLANGDVLPMGRHYTPSGMYVHTQPGTISMVDFDGGARHRSAPITREHVQGVLRRVTGVDVTLVALRRATTWTDRAQQVTCYRRGRILLAGDAAHIHSPLGGQGLNLGLGDAMNLGWKLGAAIKGRCPTDLLDSYCAERHPIGADVLDWSRAQIALMEPSAHSRALERIVRDLIGTRDGATYFAERLWGTSLRHDLVGRHPLTGRSAPDFALPDGTRLGIRLRGGRGILVDFTRTPALRAVVDRLGDGLEYVEGDAEDGLGLGAVLVRPDGVVAWACDDGPDVGEAGYAAAQWFSPRSS
jgi:2-polyprenyl-6-methoxyphenol hydroxylase-like FAD-dependent oxidoreductase